MNLTKAHRAALLIQLEKAKEEVSISKDLKSNKSNHDDLVNAFEIDHYLAKEKVRIITEALTENNIDY